FVFVENNRVVISSYSVYSSKIPPVFNNYKIALITDFHNSNNVRKILEKVEDIKPQIIVIAGDMISMGDTDFKNAGDLTLGLKRIAPVYFTSGNHERWSSKEKEFLNYLSDKGAVILNSSATELRIENEAINLIGYRDIIYSDNAMRYDILNSELKALYETVENKDLYNILVFHRANYFDKVAQFPYDLVLSGHLHGGQVNLPVIKNKILESRFQNTQYSKGYYRMNNTQMIVSAGLEKNYKYPRLFNPTEVVEVSLKYLK
ncbi:MAG: metallophosphoesterase, partial [Monoglobales bacterium]